MELVPWFHRVYIRNIQDHRCGHGLIFPAKWHIMWNVSLHGSGLRTMLKLKPEISPHPFLCSDSRLRQCLHRTTICLPSPALRTPIAATMPKQFAATPKATSVGSCLDQMQFEGPLMISTETIFVVLRALGQCSQGSSDCVICSGADRCGLRFSIWDGIIGHCAAWRGGRLRPGRDPSAIATWLTRQSHTGFGRTTGHVRARSHRCSKHRPGNQLMHPLVVSSHQRCYFWMVRGDGIIPLLQSHRKPRVYARYMNVNIPPPHPTHAQWCSSSVASTCVRKVHER